MITASPHLARLSDAERSQLEAWLVEFDLRWNPDLLQSRARELPGGAIRVPALTEMVKIDLERQWQQGRRVGVEHYLRAFPELGPADAPPLDLIETEVEVRTQFGERPAAGELCDRFPAHGDSIRRLLQADVAQSHPTVATPAPGDRSATVPESDREPRELAGAFGRYRIRRLLGRGGMGTVYLAHDTELDRPVALKIPHFHGPGEAEARERFRREGRVAAALDHPHLCRVYDVGEHEGTPYLTMAYVEGRPLGDPADGPLSATQVAAVVRKVALALGYAHARGVVHRDLKPSNILIDATGEPVVTDFGLARRTGAGDALVTRDGVPVGTPAYMSPEQVAGKSEAVGPASDVFSLGVVLYHLLAGRLPYRGGPAEVMVQVVTETPEPPSAFRPGIDPRLEAACLKAMAKAPADRFASMEAFAAALGRDQKATPVRRRRWAAALVALVAVASVVGVVIWANLRDGGSSGQPRSTQPEAVPLTQREVAPHPRPVGTAPPVIFKGHTGAVHTLAFDADGSDVLSGGDDKTVRRWSPETGAQDGVAWKPDPNTDYLVLSPDGRRVLTQFLGAKLYDTTTRARVLQYSDPGNPHLRSSAFSANGKRVVMGKAAVNGDVFAAVWDLDSNDRLCSPLHPGLEELAVVALSPDGKRGASATTGNTASKEEGLRVWELITKKELDEAIALVRKTKKPLGEEQMLRHWPKLRATALVFTADGERLLMGNALGAIFLLDPKTGDEVGRFEGHTAAVKALAVSADGRLLLSAADDGTARLWSVETRKELRKLDGHKGPVLSVSLATDGRKALTGGKDGTVRLWDLRGVAP
jgi:WD40 repeat protein/predicted Ser/Thr protein kinase